MKNTLIIFYCLIALLVTSCYNEPEDFPNEPIIRVTNVTNEYSPPPAGSGPSATGDNLVTISLEFQDGDGDLGLNSEDQADGTRFAPKVFIDGDSVVNEFHNNYFIDIYKIENNNRTLVEFLDNVTYDATFPRFPTDGSNSAIEGELDQTIKLPLNPPLAVGDTLEFDVQITDRSFNLSNKVTTPRIVLLGN